MNKNRGLTLIELMVTLAIAGMLVTAALTAATTLGRIDVAERSQAARKPAPFLRNIVEADIKHASRYKLTADGFSLQTWSLLDDETSDLHHLPTQIAYSVTRIDEETWLVRRQQGAFAGKGRTDLVCPNVKSIHIRVDEDTEPAQEWAPMPPYAAVTISFSNTESEVTFDFHRQ